MPTPKRLSDVTRYRQRARDAAARAAHAADTTSWRRSIAEADFGPDEQQQLVDALRRGASMTQAAAEIGLSTNLVYGRTQWDPDFSSELEAALTETCPAGELCGRPAGVKHGGHCAACRAAHHPPRSRGRKTASR